MATLKLTLDSRRAKQDHSYPLVFRISLDGTSRDIATGYSARKEDWNSRTCTVKHTHSTSDLVNTRMQELKATYLSKMVDFEKAFPSNGNVQMLKEFLTAQEEKKATTVYQFWEKEVELLFKARRSGNALVYSQTLTAIGKVKNLHIPFESIDYNFLKEVEAELISIGVKVNSISLYFRTLRAVYNKAINTQLVSYSHYPFRRFRIRKEATTPKVIPLEKLREFFHLELQEDSWLYDSWMMGKLMFMLIGINFKDMVLITEHDIHEGRLLYKRAKTGKMYNIKLTAHATEILEYFHGRSENTLLGKVNAVDITDIRRFPLIVQQRNKVFNKHLAKIGEMIGCKEKLHGYIFRYSWSNYAKQLGYSKDMIGEALGHNYGQAVTTGYLHNYDSALIDAMNECVCQEAIM